MSRIASFVVVSLATQVIVPSSPAVAQKPPAAPPAKAAAKAAAEDPEDCEHLYEGDGDGRPRDFVKALACFRAREDWVMVAIMQLNGESTPVDIAGARASYERELAQKGVGDADDEALDQIIKRREANPTARARRVDFCRDVARTTVSINPCERQEMDRKVRKGAAAHAQLRAKLPAAARASFDKTLRAFDDFVSAESRRAYQRAIDGSIRNQAAMAEEAVLRRHFAAFLKAMVEAGGGGPPAAPRPLPDADRELNAVYRAEVQDYAADYQQRAEETKDAALATQYRGYATDYRTLSRDTQRRWVRYRDAAADLAAARWPGSETVKDTARALITEDRIKELRQ